MTLVLLSGIKGEEVVQIGPISVLPEEVAQSFLRSLAWLWKLFFTMEKIVFLCLRADIFVFQREYPLKNSNITQPVHFLASPF